MNDKSLLEEFVAHRSETAFRTITDQYLNLVYSTALRETNDLPMAQDVTQAVFVLLARKAESLPKNVLLAGWLYRTTHFVASRAVRSELRRQRREQEAFQMQQNQSADETWKNVAPMLDEALGKLRETDRDAIILRFFQNEPLGKIGEKLGVSEEAAGKRVSRALDTLRGFFGRRGFSVTSGVLASSLARHSAHAAPAPLGQSVVTAVFMHAPSAATAHYALVQETLKAWQWAKAKWLIGLGSAAVVAILLIAPSLPAKHRSSQSPTPRAEIQLASVASAKNDSAGNDTAATSPTSTTATAPTGPVFKFQAVDGVTGKGLVGARVLVVTAQDPQHIDTKTNLVTDAQGRCDIPLVFSNCMMVAAGVLADGYEERSVFAGGNEPVPPGWVLKMYRGSTIGGVVQDEAGRPVANADILVQFFGTGDSSAREFQRERPGFPSEDIAVATTDAFGRWQFRSAPETNGDFLVAVRHPQFPTVNFQTDADTRNYVQPNRVGLDSLHTGRAVLVLKSGLGLGGIVTDEQQNPIANAKVQFGENFDDKGPASTTDGKGAFALNSLKVGGGHITITAPGFAPERLAVNVANDSKPVTVRLKPSALLRVRVVDEHGNGMPGVDVRLQGWRGNNTLEWGGATDNDGRISWDSAPVDQLNMFAGKQGYFYSRQNLMTADGEEHVIKMHKELTVSGWALDAATGQAITDFKAVPGADRLELAHGTNGQYSVIFHELNPPLQVTIEADGYEPLISEPISGDTNQVVWNAQLKKLDPSQAVTGTILFPDGTPAVGAQVALCTRQGGVTVGRGKFINYGDGDSAVKNADDQGRFSFAPDNTVSVVVAIHPRGYASVNLNHAARPLVIQLQPWGRIEGSLKLRTESNAKREVVLGKVNYGSLAGAGVSFDFKSFTVTTDGDGNFVFDQAPPGDANLYMSAGLGIPFSHQTPVQVPAGGTVQAQIGGTGAVVKGHFVLSDPTRTINWTKQLWAATVGTKLPPLAVPRDLTPQKRVEWVRAFNASDAGMARARASRTFPVNVSDDGSFSVEGVPSGDYLLNASFAKETVDRSTFTGGRIPLIGSAHQDVTISDQSPDAKEVDLGTVTVNLQ
jgi:RNA polymerase sigma factor (sigma-70 family)